MIEKSGLVIAGLAAMTMSFIANAADAPGSATGKGAGQQGAAAGTFKELPLPDPRQESGEDIGGMVTAIVSLPSAEQNYSMTLVEAKSKTSLKVDAAAKQKTLQLTDAANAVKGNWTITPAMTPTDLAKISQEISTGMGLDPSALQTSATDGVDGAK